MATAVQRTIRVDPVGLDAGSSKVVASALPTPQRRAFRYSPHKPRPSLGKLIITGHPLDLAIGGEGWFVMTVPGMPHRCELTRVGTFVLNDHGCLADESGGELFPQIRLPGELSTVVINSWGDVIAISKGGEIRVVGTIQLVPDSVAHDGEYVGPGRLRLAMGCSQATKNPPSEGRLGAILQGAVEVPPGHDAKELGPRFAEAVESGGVMSTTVRLSQSNMAHFARFLKHARRRRESRLDLQVARSQAAMLLGKLSAAPQFQIDVRGSGRADRLPAVLAARRLSPQTIADMLKFGRRNTPDRFDASAAGGDGDSERRLPGQELQVAQARALKSFKVGR